MYSPTAEIIPTLALPPGTPSTFHVTAGFGLLATVAVNCCVWIVVIEAVAGATVTAIGGGGLGGGGFAAISLLPPPPQPLKMPTASTTRAKNTLVLGLGEPVISGRHPAIFVAADVILEIVIIILDRVLGFAAVTIDAGAHSSSLAY